MANLEDIEKAVAELPMDQLTRFRAWFEEFEATRFDRKIERDATTGRLDRLAEQATAMGANAVLSVMFDSSELGSTMEEIIAFGTAVLISPTSETQQLVKLS